MPFIRGRYHVNPVMGEALEAARDAEEELRAALQQEQGESDDANSVAKDKGPIHRVEIEAEEVVRPHAGRAERGFAVRVHRHPAVTEDGFAGDDDYGDAPAQPSPAQQLVRVFVGRDAANSARIRGANRAETHIFSNHGDLLNFLRDELQKDCAR